MQRRDRQRVLPDRRSERGVGRSDRGFAAFDGGERVIAGGQRRKTFRGERIAFVGEVVGHPREAVDRDHRGTQARRHEARCDGKVLVMTDGHAKCRRKWE